MNPFGFGSSFTAAPMSRLAVATDICFWATFLMVTLNFGGRTAFGQLALVVGAVLTALCWLLHELTAERPKYTWTGTELLWIAGAALCAVQIMPLSTEWLLAVSPQIKEALPLCFNPEGADLFPNGWHQLSLAPGETASSLATFLAYGLLFLVMAQRIRTLADVERMLCGAALVAAVMAGFSLAQYFFSNSKYFWCYVYPFQNTRETIVGSFTNRNHLAHFLALGTAPLVWWSLRRLHQQEQDRAEANGLPEGMHWIALLSLLGSLGLTVMTALLSLSRGGVVSTAVAVTAGTVLLCRAGVASMKLACGLIVVGAMIVTIFNATAYDSLAKRLEQDTGREDIWQANIAVARDFPVLGTGVGSHADAHHLHVDFPKHDGYEYSHAESGYLQVASETGVTGLVLCVLFIVTSVWWCIGALGHPETKNRAAASAVFAGLLANLVQAIADFVWYVPALVMFVSLLLACAFRLHRLTREAAGRRVWSWQPPRLVSLASACVVMIAAVWMLDQKLPSAQAEPERMKYMLSMVEFRKLPDDPDERRDVQKERWQALFNTCRLDPRDSRLLEAAALGYIDLFNSKQERAENPISHGQIRDTVRASAFATPEEMHDWLKRAVGPNIRLLQSAQRLARRSLAVCPLRANSYIRLSELNFLEQNDNARELAYLQQAHRIRPKDPQILFMLGKNFVLNGELDAGMDYWKQAFQHSPRIQREISAALAEQVEPDFFLTKLDPDWQALAAIANAYRTAGKEFEAQQMWLMYVGQGADQLKTIQSETEIESTVLQLRHAYHELGDAERAAKILAKGMKRLPYNTALRSALAWDLYRSQRYTEAAEHLQWLAARQPDDEAVQKAAAHATKERLKAPGERQSVADRELSGHAIE